MYLRRLQPLQGLTRRAERPFLLAAHNVRSRCWLVSLAGNVAEGAARSYFDLVADRLRYRGDRRGREGIADPEGDLAGLVPVPLIFGST